MVHIQRVTQTRQRPEQSLGNENQHRVNAHVEAALQNQFATKNHDRGKSADDQHADKGNESRTEFDRVFIGDPVVITLGLYTPQFVGFGRVTFDCSDPAQVVRELSVKDADHFSDSGVERGQASLKTNRPPNDERHRQGRHPGDGRCGVKKDPHDHDNGCNQPQDIRSAAVEKAFELVDIVV